MTPADILRAAMDAQGVTDPVTRAGLAAICMGESQMQGYTETGYAHTANARIRAVFGSRVPPDDAALDAIKIDDRAFFNRVYGAQYSVGKQLGNTLPDDGYNFRGRGFIQLTGRANYTFYGKKIGRPDVVSNPDLANDPTVAAALAVAYILDRYHGGGFDQMMASVGNNTPDIAATKQQYFAQYTASGEFRAGIDPGIAAGFGAQTAAQMQSIPPTVPKPIDAILTAPNFTAAVKSFQSSQGLTDDGVIGPLTLKRLWENSKVG